jgi:hypothetical protein
VTDRGRIESLGAHIARGGCDTCSTTDVPFPVTPIGVARLFFGPLLDDFDAPIRDAVLELSEQVLRERAERLRLAGVTRAAARTETTPRPAVGIDAVAVAFAARGGRARVADVARDLQASHAAVRGRCVRNPRVFRRVARGVYELRERGRL